MQLKYVGPKPIISQHGISFKDGKEDKYVYLNFAIQILQAIDHDTVANNSYEYDIQTKRLNDEQIQNVIFSYYPKLESIIDKESNLYLTKLYNEIKEIENSPILSSFEKSAFQGNLELMKSYRVQRGKNKVFYLHAIDIITEIVKKRKIKKIVTPFNEKFWHILNSVHTHLASLKIGIQSNLEVINTEEGNMQIALIITNNT